MARASMIGAGILLGTGLAVSLLSASILLNRNASVQVRLFSTLALASLGLPPIASGTKLVLKNQDEAKRERNRLLTAFYDTLKAGGGKTSVLQFAMQAKISGSEAKVYLDERAKEFNASFETSDSGNVVYAFDLGVDSCLSAKLSRREDSYDVILVKPTGGWSDSFWGPSILREVESCPSIDLSEKVRRQIKRARYPVTLASGLSKENAKSMRKDLEKHHWLDIEIEPTQGL